VFFLALGKAFFAERPKKKHLAKPPALGKEADSGSETLMLCLIIKLVTVPRRYSAVLLQHVSS
jgi:hypothetical protein